ncbi:hypothetical protein PR202_gb09924 [Eleusine coracana subsp. coracana]|uniref:Uncharacterized protein n=1 Tax=Eleusine coracana subsp. coracana TaxID=191504 RepID=A0AAV5EHY7_ELECO|nr:hypothetical protein PR202_gb09924 [Eleusine coracana subsp. coracana]
MAALQLQCCRVSPPAAFSPASASARPPPSTLHILPTSRCARCFPRLKLQLGEMTTPARPRLAVQAHYRGSNAHPRHEPPDHFVEERRYIFSRIAKIIHIEEGYLLVLPTIRQGVEATQSFVELMVARRQRALERPRQQYHRIGFS